VVLTWVDLVSWALFVQAAGLPMAEIISREFYCFSRFVSRVYLGVNDMSFGEDYGKEVMDVGGEALEARLIAHEPMDEHEQQGPAAIPRRFRGDKRVR